MSAAGGAPDPFQPNVDEAERLQAQVDEEVERVKIILSESAAASVQAQVHEAIERVKKIISEAAAERVRESVARILAEKVRIEGIFEQVIQQLEADSRFYIKKHKDFDYYIGLPDHKMNIDAHHIHFYIKEGKLVWHYSFHPHEDKRDPKDKSKYHDFTSIDYLLKVLKDKFKEIPTLKEKLMKAQEKDPFKKKGQRQKRSSRKRSSRKRS